MESGTACSVVLVVKAGLGSALVVGLLAAVLLLSLQGLTVPAAGVELPILMGWMGSPGVFVFGVRCSGGFPRPGVWRRDSWCWLGWGTSWVSEPWEFFPVLARSESWVGVRWLLPASICPGP